MPRVVRVVKERWQPLELRYRDCLVVIGGRKLRLAAADFAFYATLVGLRMRSARSAFVRWNTVGLVEVYLMHYAKLVPGMSRRYERVENSFKDRSEIRKREWFDERKSRSNRGVGSVGAWPGCNYEIVTKGTRPNTYSGLVVDPSCIRIRDVPSVDSGFVYRVGAG